MYAVTPAPPAEEGEPDTVRETMPPVPLPVDAEDPPKRDSTSGSPASATVAGPDTTDSLGRVALRDSILVLQDSILDHYTVGSLSMASTRHPFRLTSAQVFRADASGVSELMRLFPLAVAVPMSLSSSQNRFLLYGLPYPHACNGIHFGQVLGTDLTSTSRISSLNRLASGDLSFSFHPLRLQSPETSIYWENGVFGENVLDVRFARPLTRKLRVGVFTDYRRFAGKKYSHRAGGIYDFYASLVDDTTLVSHTGRTPLTDELASGIRMEWESDAGSRGHVSYHYADTENELVFPGAVDSAGVGESDELNWERLVHYRNDLDASVLFRGDAAGMRTDLRLAGDIHKRSPLVGSYEWGKTRRRGAERSLSATLAPFVESAAGTLSVPLTGGLRERRLYGGAKWNESLGSGGVAYAGAFPLGPLVGEVGGGIYGKAAKLEGARGGAWAWDAHLGLRYGSHRARLWGKRKALLYEVPWNPSAIQEDGVFGICRMFGAESFLAAPKGSLYFGYVHVSGLDRYLVLNAWPNRIVPYVHPGHVFTVAPTLGRFGGAGIGTRWMISDEKPHLKTQAVLSYGRSARGGKQHINVDLVLDYWSWRDPQPLGRRNLWKHWEREVFDLSLKTSVRIKTFRLFYKMDNLLNRKFAYLPGYLDPGLTFRWGFAWLIP